MYRIARVFVLFQVIILCMLSSAAYSDRVLVVTTQQFASSPKRLPELHEWQNGEYVITDLVCAGQPFDVVTYNKFVNLDLSMYDVIILNGHTTPVPVSQVAGKCLSAVQSGHKVFVNGQLPYQRYDSMGTLVEQQIYATSLFPVDSAGTMSLMGPAVIPSSIEKDSAVTAAGNYSQSVNYFTYRETPPLKMTLSGRAVGFVYPQGGAIGGDAEYTMCILNYGKLVQYLRYGDIPLFGFANDRIEGLPIASFEVHCDNTGTVVSNNNMSAMATQYGMPLYYLLVERAVSASVASQWNVIANSPLVRIGSHSHTHPTDWPSLPDLAYETTGALDAQRLLIPSTGAYLNFSGSMNPTSQQIDQLTSWGQLFGGAGQGWRKCMTSSGARMSVQPIPTRADWLIALSQCDSTPYCLAHTMENDYSVMINNQNYMSETIKNLAANAKYGMYNFGYIHDYMFNPSLGYQTNGVLMYDQIRAGFAYMKSQGVKFVFTDDLVRRLRDYVCSNISCVNNLDGSITISAHRPNHLINEIKVGFKGDLTPVAVAGPSVVAQRLGGECAYIEMPAEVDSSVQVQWSLLPPVAPTVTYISPYISYQSVVTWVENTHPGGIAEYQYAVGMTPGGTDALNWTSVGTATSGKLTGANLQNGSSNYVSVRARYAGSGWSPIGSGGPYIADNTPPSTPVVLDEGVSQESTTDLNAGWSSIDAESGVVEYKYAIGTSPGDAGVLNWMSTTDATMGVHTLSLRYGLTYYISVKARNGMGMWSSVGSSDGIQIVVPTDRPSIGLVKQYPYLVHVVLDGNSVTAKFDGEFYVESLDRSSGIRVESAQPVELDQKVAIDGYTHVDGGETVMEVLAPIVVTGNCHLKPIMFKNSELGGSTDPLRSGPSDGKGLNNVGLLVKTFGKITNVGATYIDIDDGSAVPGVAGQVGVRVTVSSPHSFAKNSYVFATGISTLTPDGSNLRRSIRTRSNADVVVIQ